jgi:hypothetical protein
MKKEYGGHVFVNGAPDYQYKLMGNVLRSILGDGKKKRHVLMVFSSDIHMAVFRKQNEELLKGLNLMDGPKPSKVCLLVLSFCLY